MACLAAVSSSGSLIFLMVSFFNGVAMGAGVIIARYFGAKNYAAMRRAIHTDVAFGIVAGLIVAFVLKGQLKSVRKQYRANDYVKKDSMNLTHQSDVYLYRTVSRTKKSSSSSSGSGGSARSKGGGSF